MSRGAEKRARRAGRDPKPTHADIELARLRKTRIGPAFPESVATPREPRKVVRLGKDTKPPYLADKPRKAKDRVTIRCRLCPWSTTASTWRPARRRAAEHAAAKHKAVAA